MLPSPSRVAATSLRILPRKALSRALGRMARVSAPRPLLRAAINAYCSVYGVELGEYEVPSAGFDTFDGFFTRRLKPGQRPLDTESDALISPADGRVEDAGLIDVGSTLRIKGRAYSVGELLADRWAGSLYAGGQFAVIYLSPRDYHRVHAPVDGRVRSVRHVPGTLFPVNAIGLQHVPKLFARNERVVVEQASAMHGSITSCSAMLVAFILNAFTMQSAPTRPTCGAAMSSARFTWVRRCWFSPDPVRVSDSSSVWDKRFAWAKRCCGDASVRWRIAHER
jgi:phosphatidylserine decarboxylase